MKIKSMRDAWIHVRITFFLILSKPSVWLVALPSTRLISSYHSKWGFGGTSWLVSSWTGSLSSSAFCFFDGVSLTCSSGRLDWVGFPPWVVTETSAGCSSATSASTFFGWFASAYKWSDRFLYCRRMKFSCWITLGIRASSNDQTSSTTRGGKPLIELLVKFYRWKWASSKGESKEQRTMNLARFRGVFG